MIIDLDEIIPGQLWVGGYVREHAIPELQVLGITAVVSLQTDEDLRYHGISPESLKRAYHDAGIAWHRIPTQDFDRNALVHSLPDAVALVRDVLADSEAKLYLHCSVGINRSATAAAGFLILSRGISAREACQYLVSRRDCSPSLDILGQYEKTIRNANCNT
jgi:protein-tyrosine phosphatase